MCIISTFTLRNTLSKVVVIINKIICVMLHVTMEEKDGAEKDRVYITNELIHYNNFMF